MFRWRAVVSFSALAAASACGDSSGSEAAGSLTAAPCPDASVVSYEADIQPLMATYCTKCHAKAVPPAQRNGAPTDHNFDSELGVLSEAQHVDMAAGASGNVVNTKMPPPGYPAPSVQERQKLSEWLACTAPPNTSHEH